MYNTTVSSTTEKMNEANEENTEILEDNHEIYQLNKIGRSIADAIVLSMTEREHHVLQNRLFLTAIYVDPRNRILLSNDQTDLAKETLYDVVLRLKRLQKLVCEW